MKTTVTIKSKQYKEIIDTSIDGEFIIILPSNSGIYEVKITKD